MLLAGAVAYYTLLSIIPVFALVLIVLSQFLEQELLLGTVSTVLTMAAPISADVLSLHLEAFLSHWKVIGTMGILLLLFFSSLAFSVLENAMSMDPAASLPGLGVVAVCLYIVAGRGVPGCQSDGRLA